MKGSRNYPRLSLLAGIFLCGIKWPGNWIWPNEPKRKKTMIESEFGILDSDPRMVDAWDRIENKIPETEETYNRLSHNLTNLAIEWNRRWLPWSTKFLSCLFVGSFVVNLILLIWIIW